MLFFVVYNLITSPILIFIEITIGNNERTPPCRQSYPKCQRPTDHGFLIPYLNLPTNWYEFNFLLAFEFYIKMYDKNNESWISCDDDKYSLNLITLDYNKTNSYHGMTNFGFDVLGPGNKCPGKRQDVEVYLYKMEFKADRQVASGALRDALANNIY